MTLDTAAIRAEIDEIQTRIDGDRLEAATVAARIRAAEQELALLTELLRVRGDGAGSTSPEDHRRPAPVPASSNGTVARVSDAAAEILKGRGEPMSIRDLYAAIQDEGVQIPGRGQQVNLIAAIRNHPHIARPARGVYAYSEAAARPEGKATTPRRRRGSVRAKAKTRTTRTRRAK